MDYMDGNQYLYFLMIQKKKTVRKMPLAKYNDESKPLFLTLDHTDYREGQIMENFLNEIQRWGGETNLE